MPSLLFIVIILTVTSPYGIYNKLINDTYVVASSGLGGHFVTGHNDDFYKYAIDPPSPENPKYRRLKNMDFDIYRRLEPELMELSHQQQQNRYLQEGLRWCLNNPRHFVELLWFNLKHFLTPGFSRDHQPFNLWLFALIISTPVFLLAYFEIIRQIVSNVTAHFVIISIFSGMLLFSLGFYAQNRFRVVTIEPFYLMYACSGFIFLKNFLSGYFRKRYR